MKYDGIVVRMKKNDFLYLFILNPDTNEIMDGINISEHKCYENLNNNNLMVVTVDFRDGTEELDNIDLEEFIYGDKYGRYDVFLHIQDVTLFTVGLVNGGLSTTIEEIIKKGHLSDVAKDCIEESKNNKENE